MNRHDPEVWFILRSRIEAAWEHLTPQHKYGAMFNYRELGLLRDELVRLKAVLDKCIDISQGMMPDQHRRDLQSLLVALGYLEPRVVAQERTP